MANTLRFKRGLLAGLPSAAVGEPLFTTDTFDLYIGTASGTQKYQKFIASGTTSQLLRGDGSLLTMPIVLSSPANGEVLKYNGTNWVNSSDAGITGSGVAGQVAYFTGATTQGGSNNLFWDNTSIRLGVGRIPTARRFEIQVGNGGIAAGIGMYDGTGSLNNIIGIDTVTTNDLQIAAVSGVRFYSGSTLGNVVTMPTNERMRLHSTGNLHLGGTSDNGLRFQVTGDGYFSGRVHIGTTSNQLNNSFQVARTMTGATVNNGVNSYGQIQSDVTTEARYFMTDASTQAASFTLASLFHYRTFQSAFGAGSSVTNQYGFFIDSTLTGATNNYGFYGNIASGTGRWNLYMNGSADNFTAGDFYVGIPTLRTSDASIRKFILNGSQSGIGAEIVLTNETANDAASNAISFVGIRGAYGISGQIRTTRRGIMTFHTQDLQSLVSPPERMRLDASGNLGLGVVPSAWRSIEKAIQIGAYTAITNVDQYTTIRNNNYVNSSNQEIYSNSSFRASVYYQYNGTHVFLNAPVGTAGGVATFTQAMTLDASGNLGLGTTTLQNDTGYKTLSISGSTGGQIAFQTAGATRASIYHDGTNYHIINTQNGYIRLLTNNTERLHIFADGNVGIATGNSNAGYKLDVNGTMRVSGASTFTATGASVKLVTTSDSAIWTEIANSGRTFYLGLDNTAGSSFGVSGASVLYSDGSRPMVFFTNATERMRLDASGNLAVGTTTTTNRLEVWGSGNTAARIVGQSAGNATLILSSGGVTAYSIKSGNGDSSLRIDQDGTERIMLASGGNLLIGTTTNSTFKLDVNGTMRVSGASTFSSTATIGAGTYKLLSFDDASGAGWRTTGGASIAPYMYLYLSGTSGQIGFYINNNPKFAITNSGIDVTGAATFSSTISSTGTNGFAIGNLTNTQRIQYGSDVATSFTLLTAANAYAGLYAGAVVLSGNLTVDTNTFFVDAANNRVGVKQSSPTSSLHVDGSNARSYVTKTANYTMTENDYTVLCDTTSGGFTITLPAASGCAGRIYCIKKTVGNSGVNNVTIDGNASETIDGSTTISLQCRSSVIIQSDGSNWWVLAEKNDASCI